MLVRALVFIAGFLVPFAGQAAEQIDFGRYHALVIGINAYQDDRLSRLETAVNDASAVHDLLLRRYGFESRLLLNPTRDELVGAMEKLRSELSEHDNLLIYYAGHGQLDAVTDDGYWLPVDAEADDRTNWVPISRITSTLKGMFAKHVLVVADSCFSGALTRDGPVVKPGGAAREAELKRIAGLRARMALTSGALEPVFDGGGDGYSVFARAFLEALRDNDRALDGYGLYSRLRQQVVMAAEQTPQYSQIRLSDHEGGDFIFVPKGSTVVVVTPGEPSTKPAFDERALDLAFWDSIKDSQDPADYEAYLAQYPKGTFAALVRNRLKKLKEKQIAAVVAPPKPPTPPAPVQPAVGVYQGLKPGEVFGDCPECPEMVVIPAGSFTMGSPAGEEGRYDVEGPQHRVSLRSFALAKHEATFAEWDACVAAGGCNGYRPKDEGWGRGKRPAINVGWKDAKAYVAWLSRRTGKRYRLPSEAEWEYAARAGTTTAFHFGPTITPDQANYNGNYTYDVGTKGAFPERTVPVGSFPSNAFGLHDVHGNVFEWVEDCWHESYSGAPTDGSAWTTGANCNVRLLRGGFWANPPMWLRSANRGRNHTEHRGFIAGFRVARSLDR